MKTKWVSEVVIVNIFTSHSLIDNYVYKNKKNLYVCFIDVRKVFDKVNLRHLWKKMIDLGLTGKFLRIIRSMYDKVSSCVIATDGLTDMIKLDKLVRQGSKTRVPIKPTIICIILERSGGLLDRPWCNWG